MIEVSDSITIWRLREEVYDFLVDVTNLPRWQSDVVSATITTAGEARVGTRFTEEIKLGPETITAECEITDLVPTQRIGFTIKSSALHYEAVFALSDVEGGTLVDVSAAFEPKGPRRVLEPVYAREVERGVRDELEKLKSLIEGGPRAGSAA